jgi:hypothetical protein
MSCAPRYDQHFIATAGFPAQFPFHAIVEESAIAAGPATAYSVLFCAIQRYSALQNQRREIIVYLPSKESEHNDDAD